HVDWGDGSDPETIQLSPGGREFTATHNFEQGGIYNIAVTAVDGQGGEANETVSAVVQGMQLKDGQLQIIGRSGNDRVVISPAGRNRIRVQLIIPGMLRQQLLLAASELGSITMDLGAGNDRVSVSSRISVPIEINAGAGNDNIISGSGPAIIDGGEGNDRIRTGNAHDQVTDLWGNNSIQSGGGNDTIIVGEGNDYVNGGLGHDIISGGGGNDRLVGHSGHDILIGGEGADRVYGYNDDDLLIAGKTEFESASASLSAAGIAWADGRLQDALLSLGSIEDDLSIDLLFGGRGDDELFGDSLDRLRP
ncbi:MAG: hypothetical protein KDA81_13580, partial [Planctomycetaceae bacterium]|nr:hypothetical protein [Planctomycetaceae bacterium]